MDTSKLDPMSLMQLQFYFIPKIQLFAKSVPQWNISYVRIIVIDNVAPPYPTGIGFNIKTPFSEKEVTFIPKDKDKKTFDLYILPNGEKDLENSDQKFFGLSEEQVFDFIRLMIK